MLGSKHQCQYARHTWDFRKVEESIAKVSRGSRSDMQNYAHLSGVSDYQLFCVSKRNP